MGKRAIQQADVAALAVQSVMNSAVLMLATTNVPDDLRRNAIAVVRSCERALGAGGISKKFLTED